MSDQGARPLPTCVNGHRMVVGATVCPVCAAPVKRSTMTHSLPPEVESAAAPEPTRDSNTRSSTGKARIVGAIVAAGALIAGGVAAVVAVSGQAEPSEPLPASLSADPTQTCADMGLTVLPIGASVTSTSPRSCFSIQREVALTISVTPEMGTENLVLTVTTASGAFVAGGDGAVGGAPEVFAVLFPGTYVVELSSSTDQPIGSVTLTSRVLNTDPSPTSAPSTPADQAALPGRAQCGTPDVPLITNDGSATPGTSAPAACVEITADAWVKMGLISTGSSSAGPDLVLSLHRFDETGRPRFVRSFDDAFGSDPEASANLTTGVYLLQAEEWRGGAVGEVEIYADSDQSYVRTGLVSEGGLLVTAENCLHPDLRPLALGGVIGFEDDALGYTCITVTEGTVIDLDVLSLAQQDLTLEIIGFDENDTPRRFGWADEFIFVEDFDDVDPRIQTFLPAGTYFLHVYEFNGDPVGDYTIAATEITVP